MLDALPLLESAYELGADEQGVLTTLAKAATRIFPTCGSVVVSEWHADRTFDVPRSAVERGDDRFPRVLHELVRSVSQDSYDGLFNDRPCFHRPIEAVPPAVVAMAYARKLEDLIQLVGTTDGRTAIGVSMVVPSASVRSPSVRDYLGRVAQHLGAAWKLRQNLRRAGPVAELRPDGTEVFLSDELGGPTARAALRRAVLHRELARARRRSAEPFRLWPALVEGRWTLVDAFSAGGTRHVVAYENPPGTEAVRALAARQRTVLRHAMSGRSGKWIALELGLSEATVTRALHEALRRIGLSDLASVSGLQRARFELVDRVRAAGAVAAAYLESNASSLVKLTREEREVLRRWVAGKSAKLIASERGTSIRTVEHQTASIYRKLRVSSRRELLSRYA